MMQKRTVKKNISFHCLSPHLLVKQLSTLVESVYTDLFKVYRKSSTSVAIEYLSGLLSCEKGHKNMERMVEQVKDSDYKRYIHFLSVSEWGHEAVNTATLKAADQCLRVQKRLSGKPTGLIFDETSHLKKGDKSVGVKRQYAGVCGKVDNCQVFVHTSLCNKRFCTLVGTSLFLPQEWAEDSVRCMAAGIPKSHQVHKTKPELALALVKDAIAQGVEFDFVGGDGLYGHNAELTRSLDNLPNLLYVLDVHKDELVFLEEPTFSIPQGSGSRGRKPTLVQPNIQSIQLQKYVKGLSKSDFTLEKVRKTAKGWKQVQVHTVTIWHWDGKEEKAQKELPLLSVRDARLLVIAKLFATQKEVELCIKQMEIRHQQRQRDIDRHFKKSILVK